MDAYKHTFDYEELCLKTDDNIPTHILKHRQRQTQELYTTCYATVTSMHRIAYIKITHKNLNGKYDIQINSEINCFSVDRLCQFGALVPLNASNIATAIR